MLKIKDSVDLKELEKLKQAKQEVINELLEWASYKIRDYETSMPRLEMINSFIKKLNQMKEVE